MKYKVKQYKIKQNRKKNFNKVSIIVQLTLQQSMKQISIDFFQVVYKKLIIKCKLTYIRQNNDIFQSDN